MLSLNQLFVSQKRLSRTAASAPPAESANPWDPIVKEIEVMKPHFAGQAAEAAAFAEKWSGGDDAAGLHEDAQLGTLAKAALTRAPKWPIACLKTLLQAPELFCRRKGEASMFTGADVKLMETRLNADLSLIHI